MLVAGCWLLVAGLPRLRLGELASLGSGYWLLVTGCGLPPLTEYRLPLCLALCPLPCALCPVPCALRSAPCALRPELNHHPQSHDGKSGEEAGIDLFGGVGTQPETR
jgi:hypothetical protein